MTAVFAFHTGKAVSSQTARNRMLALHRLSQEGTVITSINCQPS